MGNRVLAVDFDGTCVEHKFPEVGPPMPHAIPVLKELVRRGWKVVLWTCREDHEFLISKRYLTAAEKWFKDNDIPLCGVNKFDSPEMYYADWTVYSGHDGPRKLWAQYYIDDAIPGGFQGWLNIFKLIEGEEFPLEREHVGSGGEDDHTENSLGQRDRAQKERNRQG